MCPLHAFTVYEGRETDDSEEAGQGPKKNLTLTRGRPGPHRPEGVGLAGL